MNSIAGYRSGGERQASTGLVKHKRKALTKEIFTNPERYATRRSPRGEQSKRRRAPADRFSFPPCRLPPLPPKQMTGARVKPPSHMPKRTSAEDRHGRGPGARVDLVAAQRDHRI